MIDTPVRASMVAASRVVQATDAARAWWVLRIGAALCFIGHGAFGFITKAAWVPYFGVVGIPEAWAWNLMPWIGAVDVMAGMAVLFAPTRVPLMYMTVWAAWTALLRPFAGESVFETLERAGNYGVPLAMLLAVGLPRTAHHAMESLAPDAPWVCSRRTVERVLQATTVLLLLGHGGLGVFVGTANLERHYAAIGLSSGVMPLIGSFEIVLAVAVAVRPMFGLLLFIAAWKLTTESLFYVAGSPVWEVIERAGSYAAPMAMALLLQRRSEEGQAGRVGNR